MPARSILTMTSTALITGVTGQDGAYLAKFLLESGYKVYGAVRRTSSSDRWRLRELSIDRDIQYVSLELTDGVSITRLIEGLQVDEIYNLAAQSFIPASFDQPLYTVKVNGLAVCELLEVIRQPGWAVRFYQASSCEMFGDATQSPQAETTPFRPRSPYGAAKVLAHTTTVNYRQAFGLFACCGIAFNHESPLRGPEFVTRKTAMALAEIRLGRRDILQIGNLDACRDWGFAGDYVVAMRAMLHNQEAEDFVLATGNSRSVRDFIAAAADFLGLGLDWHGRGSDEVGVDRRTGKIVVAIDPQHYRPLDVGSSVGDASKARDKLGWHATTSFQKLVEMMVRFDYDRLARS